MSATILTQDFDVTTELQLQKEVMAWFCQQDDFTAAATNTWGSTAYWRTESFGIGVYQNNNNGRHLLNIGVVENPASVSSGVSNNISYAVEADSRTGITHYKVSAGFIKTDSIALVFLKNGTVTSPVALLLSLGDGEDAIKGYAPYVSTSYSTTTVWGEYGSIRLKKASDTVFADGQISSISCRSDPTDPEGELLLTPFYAIVKTKRMAPVSVPGLYAEAGSLFPTVLTQFTAAAKTMLQVGTHVALDIT